MSIGRTAARFGQRPSSLVGIGAPLIALQLDEAIAFRLDRADAETRRAMVSSRRRGQPWGQKPAALKYESLDGVLAAELSARKAAVH